MRWRLKPKQCFRAKGAEDKDSEHLIDLCETPMPFNLTLDWARGWAWACFVSGKEPALRSGNLRGSTRIWI